MDLFTHQLIFFFCMAPSGQVEAMAMAVIFHMLSASKCSHIKTD